MGMVFWTHAYNAELTISRAIESILNQTCGEFTYYCLDNGSTDGTWRVIREYAAKDGRIIPLHLKRNWDADLFWIQIRKTIQRANKDGYFAYLDADDEYDANFLEKTLTFAKSNKLDMAVCGTKYIEAGGSVRYDSPALTLVLQGADKAKYLPFYHKYVTRYWAILYSIKLLPEFFFTTSITPKNKRKTMRKDDRKKRPAAFYDVFLTLNAVYKSERVGVMRECLHSYYTGVSTQVSALYTPNWFWWVNFSQQQLRGFVSNYGEISIDNENYINTRFYIWLKHILARLQNANAPLKVRLRDIRDIFQDERTTALLALDWRATGIQTDKRDFLNEQLAWVRGQQGNHAVKLTARKLGHILECRINEAVSDKP